MDKKYISDNKRVILITGDQSKWYEQAIFIVRKNAMDAAGPTDFIKEAESIISNYMGGLAPRTPKESDIVPSIASAKAPAYRKARRSKFDVFVNAMIVIASSVLLTMLVRSFS